MWSGLQLRRLSHVPSQYERPGGERQQKANGVALHRRPCSAFRQTVPAAATGIAEGTKYRPFASNRNPRESSSARYDSHLMLSSELAGGIGRLAVLSVIVLSGCGGPLKAARSPPAPALPPSPPPPPPPPP